MFIIVLFRAGCSAVRTVGMYFLRPKNKKTTIWLRYARLNHILIYYFKSPIDAVIWIMSGYFKILSGFWIHSVILDEYYNVYLVEFVIWFMLPAVKRHMTAFLLPVDVKHDVSVMVIYNLITSMLKYERKYF